MSVDPVAFLDGKVRLLSDLPGETVETVDPIVFHAGAVQRLSDTGLAIGGVDPVVAKDGQVRRLSRFAGEEWPSEPPPASMTWNPADKSASCALTNGNLTATFSGNSAGHFARATVSKTGGKWYFRGTHHGDAGGIGIARPGVALTGPVGADDQAILYLPTLTSVFHDGAWAGGGYGAYPGASDGDVLAVAFDLDAGRIYFGKNGTWFVGDPAAGTGGIDISAIGTTATAVFGSWYDAATIDADFAGTTGCPAGFAVIA